MAERKTAKKKTAIAETKKRASIPHDIRHTEEPVHESEARLRALSDNLPNGLVYQIDSGVDGTERRFTYISAGVKKLHEISPEEVLADPMRLYGQVYPEDLAIVTAREKKAFETMTPLMAEVRVLLPSGRTAWRLFSSAPRRLTEGRVVWDGIETDITDRKKTEESVKKGHEVLLAIFDGIDEPIYVADMATYEILFVNRVLEKLFGPPSGRKCYELFQHRTEPCPFCTNDKIRGEYQDRSYVWEFRNEVTGHWYRCIDKAIPWPDGRLVRYEMAIDITDRKQVEESLRESEEKYRALAETAPQMIFLIDRDYTIRYINPQSARYLGRPPEKIVGRCIDEIFPPNIAYRHKAALDRVFLTGEQSFSEMAEKFPTGEVWIEARLSPMRDDTGAIVGVIGLSSDITDRKKAEKERAKLHEQLANAQKMESVGRLAGGVAHDFNNMLSVILGHAEMALGRLKPDDPPYADLRRILKAAERSADLTQQLLAFARKQTIAPQVLDLNETVERMIRMLSRFIGEGVELAWLPDEKAGRVKMDPSQMDQILVNLCVNARDALGDDGKVTIETGRAVLDDAYCAAHAGCAPGEYALLAVSDNGCGMEAATIAHIFEPFFTTKERGKGTGLGLATVYGVVRQNNGFVNVYSEPGRGTTFRIYLPHCDEKTQPAPKEEKGSLPAGGGETILLVEDEAMIREIARKMLALLGYTVVIATTPDEALRLAREHAGAIHLLLTDVVMPGMNGRDLAARLKVLHPGVKQLFMSGYTANVIAHHGVLDPDIHFLQKPFSMNDLAAKVREALGEK